MDDFGRDLTGRSQLDHPGTYLLLLQLSAAVELTVGSLGKLKLPAGWYVYAGSALGGLRARLRRHVRRGKPHHWHVDALRAVADLVAVAVHVGPERLECVAAALVAALPGATMGAARFGASDCRCTTHLVYFAGEPALRLGPGWRVIRQPKRSRNSSDGAGGMGRHGRRDDRSKASRARCGAFTHR